MSQLEVLGSARARNATTVGMVQQGPNPARDAGTIVDMEVDKNDEEDTIVDENDDDSLLEEDLIDYNEDGNRLNAKLSMLKCCSIVVEIILYAL
jgi:hypothetical protein